MAKRHAWTPRQENYLETLRGMWTRNVPVTDGKQKYDVANCPIDHAHAVKRGYCLISQRQWIIYLAREQDTRLDDVSERAIWTKYGRVNGLRENGRVKRNLPSAIRDSYESPSVTLVSNFGARDSQDTWHKWLVASGLPRLGGGVSRDVYDLGDGNVLKIAKWHESDDNNSELNLWKNVAGTEDEKYFARIIAADTAERWIVMEKAETRNHDNVWGQDVVRRLESVISQFGLYDIHYGNVGVINGRPVLIDYAR